MARRLPTPCRHPRCPNLTHEQYCDEHKAPQRQRSREYDQARGSSAQRGYGARWRKLRLAVLTDEPLCRACLEHDMLTPAAEVDHIVPKAQGGNDDPDNLQPLCKPCHSRKTALESGKPFEAMGAGRPRVTVVAGPPGAGKTTYVANQAGVGDLIVDLDAIWQALTGQPIYTKPQACLPFVFAARDAMLARLDQPSDIYRAWIISGAPKPKQRQALTERYGAGAVVLEVDEAECMRRIMDDPRRGDRAELWRPLVERWWQQYEPLDGEMRITPQGEGGSNPYRS